MKKLLAVATAFLSFFTVLTACASNPSAGQSSSDARAQKPVIAVTVVPEATFAKAVCGDYMDVITAVPPGYSPETYDPTPKEKEELSRASVYFAVGVPVEEATILPSVSDESIKIVKLQEEVAKQFPDRTFPDGERDPHIWLSPKRAKAMTETIAAECGAIDPQNKDVYEQNAESYTAKLDSLDSELKNTFSDLQNKTFLVFHPAFGYLAEDYGLTMYSLEEEGKEATPQHLREMIDLAKEKNVRAIFYQKEIDSKQSEAFAEEIGGKTIQLSPLAADYIENLKKMADTMAEAMK